MTSQRRCLFLLPTSDYAIKDEAGNALSIDEAKRRWNAGEVDDWNISFGRLVARNFDLEKVKASYMEL